MARKKSIHATAAQRTLRKRESETIANARPPASPSGMTMRQITIVCSSPARTSGSARSMMARLKNCGTIVSIRPYPRQPELEEPAQHDHREEQDYIGDPSHHERRGIAGKRLRGGSLIEDFTHPDHGPERRVLGDGDRAVGEWG